MIAAEKYEAGQILHIGRAPSPVAPKPTIQTYRPLQSRNESNAVHELLPAEKDEDSLQPRQGRSYSHTHS